MADEHDKDDVEQQIVPDVSKQWSNVTTYWKIAEIASYLLLFLAPLGAILAPWLPGVLHERYFSLAFFSICIAVGLGIRFFVTEHPAMKSSIAALKSQSVFSKAERQSLGEMLKAFDRRRRRAWFVACLLGIVLVAVIVGQPLWHRLQTAVPSQVPLAEARYFQPTQEAELLNKAPFLGAVRKSLLSESGDADRSRIVIFKTQPFEHPTHEFILELDSDEARFDLTGYAFRQRGDSYEALQADLSHEGIIRLVVPASEDGDYVFGILRLTLKGPGDFPTDLTRDIRVTPKHRENLK